MATALVSGALANKCGNGGNAWTRLQWILGLNKPGFTRFGHAAGGAGSRLEGHDFYFTVGANIGTSGCPIPTGGIPWRPISPLIVLEQWPVSSAGDRDRFTTVASWRGPYGPIQYGS